MQHDDKGPVGVILAGGGARGAYEAGALSVLLPALEARGQRPTVFIGTSAGALNAVLFAAHAHQPAQEAADAALAVWRHVGRAQVIKPILGSGLKAGLHYLAQLLRLPVQLNSVLDASPLQDTLGSQLDWQQLHRNTQDPRILAAVAVVATACSTGRTTVFVQGSAAAALAPNDDERAMDYVCTPLDISHVMASAAIPVLFSPIKIDSPAASAGWYIDGGVRLNVPIKPVVALGISRAIIIATDPLKHSVPAPGPVGPTPDIYAAVAEVIHAALVDSMVEDVRTLGKVNELLLGCPGMSPPPRAGGKDRSHRPIPYLFVGPSLPGQLGKTAHVAIQRRYGGGKWLLNGIDYPLLHQLLGGGKQARNELLSFLLFEHTFIESAIEMGQRDARRILEKSAEGIPWQMTGQDE